MQVNTLPSSRLSIPSLETDIGGSIRLPSFCYSVVGNKPTWDRVSRPGVFPLAESLDHVGPTERSVADAAALLAAIARLEEADPTAAQVPVGDYLQAALTADVVGLTIGIDRTSIT